MMLPENKKVVRDATSNIKVWVYGQPNIGKTTFANQFPDTLMLNTDGNYKGVDSPVISITDWEQFCSVVDEILEGKHEFKTIVIDLLEDVYLYARNFYCKKLKIDHEGDLGFGKAYDIIQSAFVIALRKLANCQYNLIFLSHEKEVIIKDRIGRETTIYRPNISEKLATKISGMMEITGRLYAETVKDDGDNPVEYRKLFFGSASDMFTGNKIKTLKDEQILMDETKGYDNLVKAIKGDNVDKVLNEDVVEEPETIEVTEEKPKESLKISRKKDK